MRESTNKAFLLATCLKYTFIIFYDIVSHIILIACLHLKQISPKLMFMTYFLGDFRSKFLSDKWMIQRGFMKEEDDDIKKPW